jgi:apolipoprotein N-acyltransferase
MQGETPYVRWGNRPVVLALVLVVVLAVLASRLHKRPANLH